MNWNLKTLAAAAIGLGLLAFSAPMAAAAPSAGATAVLGQAAQTGAVEEARHRRGHRYHRRHYRPRHCERVRVRFWNGRRWVSRWERRCYQPRRYYGRPGVHFQFGF